MKNDLGYDLGNVAEQFGYFVEDYQNQLETHETLNRMNAHLSREHKKADLAIQKQDSQINQTMLDLKRICDEI